MVGKYRMQGGGTSAQLKKFYTILRFSSIVCVVYVTGLNRIRVSNKIPYHQNFVIGQAAVIFFANIYNYLLGAACYYRMINGIRWIREISGIRTSDIGACFF